MLKKVLLLTGIYSCLLKRSNMAYFCCICQWKSIFEPRRLFHRFPTDQSIRQKWFEATGRSEKRVSIKTSVCSTHFKKSCYVVDKKNGKKTLKKDSVPTLRLTQKKSDVSMKKGLNVAKTAANKELKCDVCGDVFTRLTALKNHLKFRHLSEGETNMKTANILRTYGKQAKNVVPNPNNDTGEVEKASKSKTEVAIECPKCPRTFNVYFSAYRHIQKVHCVDSKGNPVAPDSPYLIKPISIEQCLYCKEKVRSMDVHNCVSSGIITKDQYLCLGCHQPFEGLALFECHLKGVHSNYESFYFQDKGEFLPWKMELESQTKTKFIMLNKTTSKQVYHCTYQPIISSNDGNVTQLCPSSIVVQEFSKGIQVVFFKEHCDHSFEEYIVPNQYESKSVKAFMQEIEVDNISLSEDDNDLYVQFKRIMNNIVVNAAKLNITMLKNLKEKALEITAFLNNYDEDDDYERASPVERMPDEQISSALTDMLRDKKRKADVTLRESKRIKWDSKDDENDENNETTKQNVSFSKKEEPSSFNESYMSFVDKTFSTPKTNTKQRRKEIVKTKIGQFIPNSPKKESPPKKEATIQRKSILSSNKEKHLQKEVQKKTSFKEDFIWKVTPDTEYEVRERDNDCNILVLKI